MQSFFINGLAYDYAGENPLLPARPKEAPLEAIKRLLPDFTLRRFPASARTGLATALAALEDAGLAAPLKKGMAGRAGIYIGSSFGPVENSFAFMDSIFDDGHGLASPTAFSHSVNNAFCGLLSVPLGIHGPSCTTCVFGLSFASALNAAATAMACGQIDLALVGALEEAGEPLASVYGAADFSQAPGPAAIEPPRLGAAVFFVLANRANEKRVRVELPARPPARSQDRVADVMEAGFHTLADQALAVAAAVEALRSSAKSRAIRCRHTEPLLGKTAEIILSRDVRHAP